MSWQLPLPDGGDALGWEVEITADLELVKERHEVLAISGSVRQGSYNTALLRAAAECSPDAIRRLAGLTEIPPTTKTSTLCPTARGRPLRDEIQGRTPS